MPLTIDHLTIRTLSAAYQAATLRPVELIAELYARIEREALEGAWIHLAPRAEVLHRALELEATPNAQSLPLYGIPFAVKDNVDICGMPTTAGCPAYLYHPTRTAPVVDALLKAGALCLGKTNLDQFATGLVGSRSAYGVARNIFDREYLAGGSSSGSALVVAAHHVCFAIATDTAGSGRVPAALNNIVGLKPSVGRWSTAGIVPACATLDCAAVFAHSVADAVRVRNVIEARSQVLPQPAPARFRFGVPGQLDLVVDSDTRACFERAQRRLERSGGTLVELDFAPFAALGELLYGPFVWERFLSVGAFIEAHPDDVLPVTRDIILRAKSHSATDVMAAVQQAHRLRGVCLERLRQVDFLLLPTTPGHMRVDADHAAPQRANDQLGIYTRFANFLGSPVVAVPQDFRSDGLPSSVSLVGRPGEDEGLDALADALHRDSDAGMGRSRAMPHPLQDSGRSASEARLAVVGAHMRELPLNHELLRLGATYLTTTRTAPRYRLFALPGGPPERPGLVRANEEAHAIEVEVWTLSWTALGELLRSVPPPLTIGSLELEDGVWVRGFLCEAHMTSKARDISDFGGYRAYLKAARERCVS